jgi:protein-S-isoprenylcysteine O-methyltransferase Ste14
MPISSAQPGSPDLQKLQRLRKRVLMLGVGLCVLLLLFTESGWRYRAPEFHALIRTVGLILILACILGRTWCTLYIGGMKKRELVSKGPYSIVRNPLYVFTSIGVAGIGAQFGSIVIAALLVAGTLAVFLPVVRQEESFLASTFPDTFPGYAARVPRFWPRFSAWQDADELLVRPDLVRRTFFDACLFLLAVPVARLMDLARDADWFAPLMNLP